MSVFDVVRAPLRIRRIAMTLAMAAAWCALWGSVSTANVLSGLLVGAVATSVGGAAVGGVRIVPLAHLLWLVVLDLIVSTAVVVREVLTPTDYTDEAIVAVPVPASGRKHLLFMYIAITVTPGTAVVACSNHGALIHLHVLHGDRSESVTEHVEQLFALAAAAFSVGDDDAAGAAGSESAREVSR